MSAAFKTSLMSSTSRLTSTLPNTVIVPTYDWATFLGEHFRRVPQMKSYHHFTFSSSASGLVTLKQFSDSTSTTFRILADDSWVPTTAELPPQIMPSGLSDERQWYLYKEIREFCRDGTEDLTCPLPSTPLQQHGTAPDDDDVPAPPAAKRPRKCGVCGIPGHTRRTCTEGGEK